jgi:hypothetical protein
VVQWSEFLATDPEVLVRFQIYWNGVHSVQLSAIEELLERKSSGSGLENRDYGLRGFVALTTRHPSICRS